MILPSCTQYYMQGDTIEIDVWCTLKERGLGHVVRVKMSGDACNHTHEWQLLGLNMGLNGNF